METTQYFTCISYNTVDFLIQSRYVVSGVYLFVPKEAKNVVFNRETLPHIHLSDLLEAEFLCAPVEQYNVALIMKKDDFSSDVCQKIADFTETAFPASGHLALSLSGALTTKTIDEKQLRLLPLGIRTKISECGISAIGFEQQGKKQLLLSPDMLLRKFFASGLLKAERPELGGTQ
ncbi:MAG: hypothetical protein II921_00645 [Treponema sp.]|nr:hypothetical protein [Treponema sp.]